MTRGLRCRKNIQLPVGDWEVGIVSPQHSAERASEIFQERTALSRFRVVESGRKPSNGGLWWKYGSKHTQGLLPSSKHLPAYET